MCILRFWHANQCQSHLTYLRCWTCLSCKVMRSLCNVARHQCRKPAIAATIPALCAECGSLQERQLCLRAATAAGCCPARQQVQQGVIAASMGPSVAWSDCRELRRAQRPCTRCVPGMQQQLRCGSLQSAGCAPLQAAGVQCACGGIPASTAQCH